MTPEEKAKAYDEALAWMRELYPRLHGATKEDAEHYFPELRESEDERIRKELINFILYKAKGVSEEQEHSWVVYLEKQKEQKPTNSEKPKEWSEEDVAMIKRVIERIEAEIQYGDALTMAYGNQEIAWLKSLRPYWKPGEEQMLKEAAEGRISSCGLHNAIFFKDQKWTDMLDKYKEGDKVRVIVLPKEDQTNG